MRGVGGRGNQKGESEGGRGGGNTENRGTSESEYIEHCMMIFWFLKKLVTEYVYSLPLIFSHS